MLQSFVTRRQTGRWAARVSTLTRGPRRDRPLPGPVRLPGDVNAVSLYNIMGMSRGHHLSPATLTNMKLLLIIGKCDQQPRSPQGLSKSENWKQESSFRLYVVIRQKNTSQKS